MSLRKAISSLFRLNQVYLPRFCCDPSLAGQSCTGGYCDGDGACVQKGSEGGISDFFKSLTAEKVGMCKVYDWGLPQGPKSLQRETPMTDLKSCHMQICCFAAQWMKENLVAACIICATLVLGPTYIAISQYDRQQLRAKNKRRKARRSTFK